MKEITAEAQVAAVRRVLARIEREAPREFYAKLLLGLVSEHEGWTCRFNRLVALEVGK